MIILTILTFDASYNRDQTHPMIQRIDLDMDVGILNITFSEPINVALTSLKDITFQNVYSFTSHNLSVALTSGQSKVVTKAPYTNVLPIKIGQIEIDRLKVRISTIVHDASCCNRNRWCNRT